MSYNDHELLEQKMCKELDILEEKLKVGSDMSMQDLEKIDKLYHALKSKATYDAMKESEVHNERSVSMNHRTSDGNSYADGYSRGYSEAMSQMSNYPRWR